MRILVVGSGGREHALIKKIKENKNVEEIYCLPGNGGIAEDAQCEDIKAKDIKDIVKFAVENEIDYAVVAPDDPLVLGLVNELEKAGIKSFGPYKEAAIIEGSKAFAKELMKKYNIPTASYKTFDDPDKAFRYISNLQFPVVIKADGLALGKGVVIAKNLREADRALTEMMRERKFGDSGNTVVVEEYLEGPEVSVLAFTDGKVIIPMVSSMDHKRALDNDEGPNTGGMGAIAPNPYYTKDIQERCMNEIFLPTIKAMNMEGRTFKGCLYFGLMITKKGPKVIEYNCRFGDPETQVVLPLLESDLLDIMMATTNGTLDKQEVKFMNKSCCCVVVASDGYPVKYKNGFEIILPKTNEGETIVVAGAKKDGDKLVSAGGRVLGACAIGDTLRDAIGRSYELTRKIVFENGYYRNDIGRKALLKKEI